MINKKNSLYIVINGKKRRAIPADELEREDRKYIIYRVIGST